MPRPQRAELASSELVTVYAARDLRDAAGAGHNIGYALGTRFDNGVLLVRDGDYQWDPPEHPGKSAHRTSPKAAAREQKLTDLFSAKSPVAAKFEKAGLINQKLIMSRSAAEIAHQAGIGVEVAEAVLKKAHEVWGDLEPGDDLDMKPNGRNDGDDGEGDGE